MPRLTAIGIGFALTLLAIPTGSALISASTILWASNSTSLTFAAILLFVGIVGVLLPAIWYGAVWGRRHFRRDSSEPGGDEEGISELPALVTGQASTESRTIVTQTPDPTSVEFEAVFRALLSEALELQNRKLLLVVDNLDRVQPSDALSIWSTLQTFLGQSDYQQDDWIDRLWVLIPYDGDAILRLWDGSGTDTSEGTKSALATSFLDKTFQLRFRVPPLLLSNWREFLQEALELALPNHQATDFHDVYRAFATVGELEKSAPTPRDLKIFVNQIGTLHRIWQEDFPLAHFACYVLLQKTEQDIPGALLASSDLSLARRIIGSQWREVVAALHFGVPTSEARELLLRSPIESALANGDARSLSELEATHPAGFWAVLEDSVSSSAAIWEIYGPTEISKAATALTESRVLNRSDMRPEAITLRESLLAAAAAVRTWSPFDRTNSRGLVNVGRLAGDSEEFITALLAAASSAPVESAGGGERDGVTHSVWMGSAFTLIEGLVELGFVELVGNGFEIPLDPQQWVEVSQHVAARERRVHVLQYFDLKAITEIDDFLTQQVTNNQMDENTLSAVQTAIATKSHGGMKSSTNAVFSRLQTGEQLQVELLVSMMKIIRYSNAVDLITNNQISEFATNGHYLHHLFYAVNDSHPGAVGECMFGFLKSIPDGSEPNHYGNSQPGYQYLNQLLQDPGTVTGAVDTFTDIVKEPRQLPVVFEIATEQEEVAPFLFEVLRNLLNCESVSKPPDLVRTHWDVIRVVLDRDNESQQSLESFLGALPGLDRIVDEITEEDFDVEDSGLYFALLMNEADAKFLDWCISGLVSVDKESWLEVLASWGDLVELAIELKARNDSIVLGVAFSDALGEYARNVATGQEEIAISEKAWRGLYELLNDGQKELYSRRVYEALEGSGGEASEEFFSFFGPILSDQDVLSSMNTFVDRVCRPILDAGNAKAIEWLADIAEAEPMLIIEHDDQPAVSDFKERIRQTLDDTLEDDTTLADLKRIASALGLTHVDLGEDLEESEESEDIMRE